MAQTLPTSKKPWPFRSASDPKKPSKTAEKIGPSAERLKELAKTHRPPQSWYEQTDCPFYPVEE